MTDVYVMITEDRHADVDVAVFTDPDMAVAKARAEVQEYLRRPEDLDETLNAAMTADGWIYYGRYSVEGDSIRVVKREVRGPSPVST